jgi:hypothetical protein
MSALFFFVLELLTMNAVAWEDPAIPIEPPERPFLLVDAPRRVTPNQDAIVRVQLRDGGRARLSVFRVHDPADALGLAGARQGIAIAQGPLNGDAEGLLVASGALPRRGSRLTLVRDSTLTMPRPRQQRDVEYESEEQVYDSNEPQEDEVATYWVRVGNWSVRNHSLGRLPAGLYLVRVHAGPYATTALLSVGELVVIARRGDVDDWVLVTDSNGAPVAGQRVTAESNGRVIATVATDPSGIARFEAANDLTVRFVARRGEDVAFADVLHARLDPCDPRVYLATGRPFFRVGETIHLRGHVRGCNRTGAYVPLANERVAVSNGDQGRDATSDADGNFVLEIPATENGLVATVRSVRHERAIRIDHRVLPRRSIHVIADRSFATPGDVVTVRVQDDQGGYPQEARVVLSTPSGNLEGTIAPNRPATFHVPIPQTRRTLESFEISATLVDGATTILASTSIWIGANPTIVEISSPETVGASGRPFPVEISARNLAGGDVVGPVAIRVFASNGNERRGGALAEQTASLVRGDATADVTLPGRGPWLIEASRGTARAELVVWERPRPPQLSERGPLAVLPTVSRALPGERVRVLVRRPSEGRTYLSLEQGSVAHMAMIAPSRGVASVDLALPDRARGLAKIVVTRIANGLVETADATIEVATAREVRYSVATDKSVYRQGERARVVIEAIDERGRPSDGVASLWLADAGYWDLGDEDYPLPGPYLAQTGRPASAGDSTRPMGFGAEEGRVLPDARLEWNGALVPRTTYRHGWRHYGRVIRFDAQGTFAEVARALALAAGFDGAFVCADDNRRTRNVSVRIVDLPWDLAVVHIAEKMETEPQALDHVLRFECPGTIQFGGMGTIGHGAGGGGYGSGMGSGRASRQERLEGTLVFIGLRRLGPDGRLELELDMPDHPGRWRLESLLVTDEGGGARAHAVTQTERSVLAMTELPARLRPGDRASGVVRVRAPSFAGRPVGIELVTPPDVRIAEPLAPLLTLDAEGRGEARVALVAGENADPASLHYELRVRAGSDGDSVRAPLEILAPTTRQPISVLSLIGPEATDLHVPLPELARAATIRVDAASPPIERIDEALARVSEERWQVPAMRVDRMVTLRSLLDATQALPESAARTALEGRISHALEAEAIDLRAMIGATGGVAFWTGLPDSALLTAEALAARREGFEEDAFDVLRRAAESPSLDPAVGARIALALAPIQRDRALVERLVDRSVSAASSLDQLSFALRAARAIDDRARTRTVSNALAQHLSARVADREALAPCNGPVWFLCYGRWGQRGEIARASVALLDAEHPRARALATDAARWLAAQRPVSNRWIWGSADGDELNLLARLASPSRRVEAELDGQPIPITGGAIEVPAGSHALVLRFPAQRGRFTRVSAQSELDVVEPARSTGPDRLIRRFSERGRDLDLVLEATLREEERGVEISVPLPAGVSLANTRAPTGARLHVRPSEVVLSYDRLPAGVTRVTLPLVTHGPGTYAAGSARLESSDATAWALTSRTDVAVRP